MPLVSKTEAAKLAGVTRQTIHRKVKSGDLSAIGGEIDTSELLRVFGTLQRPLDIADQDSGNKAWATKPDPAVEVLARVDALESQLAVTREQLADTSKDRDEWREIAKEATSNVKLITNQGSAPKSNDNMMIFVAVAFVVGIGVAYMMLRNDVTPSDAMPLPAPVSIQSTEPETTPEPEQADVTTENVIDRLGLGGGRVTDPELINRLNRARAEKKAAEQGADVTGSVTPELQP